MNKNLWNVLGNEMQKKKKKCKISKVLILIMVFKK